MMTKRRHDDFHEGTKRKGFKDLMQLGTALHLKQADILPLPNHAPQMKPFALVLEIAGARMLLFAKLADFGGVRVIRDRTVMVT
jgi:hypothetical protein